MKKEDVLNLMSSVPADLIEEADIQIPAKHRMPKAVRTGLIAACLCAALLGTAFAAQQFLSVRVVKGDNGFTYFQGGVTYYPCDSLSDELNTLVANELRDNPRGSIVKAFNSWQQAEEFVGLKLMNNPVLDASPAPDDWGRYFNDVESQFFVNTTPEMLYVDVWGIYKVGEAVIDVDCGLITDRMAANYAEHGEVWDETFGGYQVPDAADLEWNVYTAPSGLQAWIALVDRPEGRDDSYVAVFSLNGISCTVQAASEKIITEQTASDTEKAYAALLQVLDGFVLSE